VPCKASAAWDGPIHKSRLEPLTAPAWAGLRCVAALETWRYMDGGLMVVRSVLHRDKGREAAMFWFLERLDDEAQPRCSRFGGAPRARLAARPPPPAAASAERAGVRRAARRRRRHRRPGARAEARAARDRQGQRLHAGAPVR